MELGKLLALAVGGYLVYSYFLKKDVMGNDGKPEPNFDQGKDTSSKKVIDWSLLLVEANKQMVSGNTNFTKGSGSSSGDIVANYDQWNYLLNKVSGAYGPDWEKVSKGKTRDTLLSITEFKDMVESGGLSGVIYPVTTGFKAVGSEKFMRDFWRIH